MPPADPGELPRLWISERSEQRAANLQAQLRAAHQHLGVPPLDYLIAAIAEAHSADLIHYDGDFERLAEHTDLSASLERLAPLGTLP
jgi:predicted nucleic acid-binding protein